jgi:ubiquinone/menaquinone biosynthesis C-methylase UbiE
MASPEEPQGAPADLQEVLARLYRRRFSPDDLKEMESVWRVLVSDFFQKRIDPGSTVVDVGAGACLFINSVRAARRIAVDANPDLPLRAAPGVETVVSSDLRLRELPDGTVDCVFLSNFLEHLDDYLAALTLLTAVNRVLRPGGSVMILQPNFRLVPRRYFDFVDHRLILTDASLVEALEVTGFTIREMRVRFLPYTSKSRLPKLPWLVRIYLWLRPAQWLLGGQTFVRGVKI